MKNRQILLIFACIAGLIILHFALETSVKWRSGIKHVGTFEIQEDVNTVYDVKSGNRACLVIASKVKGQDQNRYFFSCPQER